MLQAILIAAAAACSPTSPSPQTGSQTNWLKVCQSDAQCGGLECVCGTCTRRCDGLSSCADLGAAVCAASGSEQLLAWCGDAAPEGAGLCLGSCELNGCAQDSQCVAGGCVATAEPDSTSTAPDSTSTAVVTIDTALRYQTLVGFGAGVAFQEALLVGRTDKAALYDAMFGDSGFDVLRLRNRHDAQEDLTSAAEIVSAARDRLGYAPSVLMTSWSPPASLKANGSVNCAGDAATCTLSRRADGGFDYAGLATHWRASLEAYAALGVQPDYIGIQNHPNWLPAEAAPGPGCRFLPTEDVATMPEEGELAYPGFAEAIAAVRAALPGLVKVPKIVGPETTGPNSALEYAARLDLANVAALGHHLYGTDPSAVDPTALLTLSDFGQQQQRPIFQTEMQGGGLETAVLMHHALVSGKASLYLQNDFIGTQPFPVADPFQLISLREDGFVLELPYFAVRHFARDTDPGWVRVAAASSSEDLLSSAWLSPDEQALTIVVVNPSAVDHTVAVQIPDAFAGSSRVTRTVFAGSERGQDLGPLTITSQVVIPAQAVVSVALRR